MPSFKTLTLATATALSLAGASPLAPGAAKNSPITLTGDKKSANLVSTTSQQTEVVYQAKDNSLQLVTVNGPPMSWGLAGAGTRTSILNAGKAKSGTPLAIVEDGDKGQVSTHVFYLSPTPCDNGKGYYIQQLTKEPGSAKWEDVPALRGAGICASKNSDALYAIGKVGQKQRGDALRIGYVNAADNTLGEAYYGHSGWIWAPY